MKEADRLMERLDGRVALVTGAARGIGLAIAKTLAEQGATTILNGRSEEELARPVEEIRAEGHLVDRRQDDLPARYTLSRH
jgi:NAD(P)-dependent dehydrogenase (short-subunit alcohol dehydrogenase family)